jgi:hypothetical protein
MGAIAAPTLVFAATPAKRQREPPTKKNRRIPEPHGTLANRYGGKLVLGVAVVWWSLFTALTPPAALLSLSALVGARIALGLGEAAVFPVERGVQPLSTLNAGALLGDRQRSRPWR